MQHTKGAIVEQVPVIDLVPFGVAVLDAAGAALSANRTWVELTGQAEQAWRGRRWLALLDVDQRDEQLQRLLATTRRGDIYEADWRVHHPGRGRRTLHVTAVPALAAGALEQVTVTVADVTEERASTERLREQATRDPLTGLYNRAQFLEFVDHALQRRRRDPGGVVAVIFIDLDGFKATNDTFGHQAGDRLLQVVAARIQSAVRPSDVAARYGGDEFTVLCPDLASPEEAGAIAERIRDAAWRPSGDAGPCPLSLGVAIADDPREEPAAIVDRADHAMYHAKARNGLGPPGPAGSVGTGPEPLSGSAATGLAAAGLANMAALLDTLRHHWDVLERPQVDALFAVVERLLAQAADALGRPEVTAPAVLDLTESPARHHTPRGDVGDQRE